MRKLKDLVVILLMLLAVSAEFLFIYNKYIPGFGDGKELVQRIKKIF